MLPGLLCLLAFGLAGIDLAWALAGHFNLDWAGCLRLLLLSILLFLGSGYYSRVRRDARLAAMLFGAGFLTLFSAAASVLNYLLLTVAGPRIDAPLAAWDRALGFDWPAVMAFAAGHPWLNLVLLLAYSSVLPQVALLSILLAGTRDPAQVYRFVLVIALGALLCIGLWTIAPSFGAFSVYDFHARTPLALDGTYARALVRLLADGPGRISPADARGLIGFPSYHAVMALVVMRFALDLKHLRWPLLALNLLVLIATPIQGGHHLVDVLAALPVGGLCCFIVLAKRSKASRGLVNYAPKLTDTMSPNPPFRTVAAQLLFDHNIRD